MLKVSAFADEISPDLDEQIRVCKLTGVTHFELRSAWSVNVLDFSLAQREQIRSKLRDAGLGVVSIGSPIGKVKISDSWDQHFDRFKIAVDAAGFFASPLIRIFSYYAPEGSSVLDHRDEVMRRMRAKVDYIKGMDVTLVHENESHIYGEKRAGCVDLMKTIDSPKLRFAFDFANFVQRGDRPADNWPSLKPYTVHIHVKDAVAGSGKVVPAGQGDGSIAAILQDAYTSGYRGFLSLEPHLAAHEQFGGFSGEQLFKVANDAMRNLCQDIGVPLAS